MPANSLCRSYSQQGTGNPLPIEADPNVGPVRPKVVSAEWIDGMDLVERSGVGNKVGDPRHVEDRIDLVARPHDVIPIQEIVTGQQRDTFGESIAEVRA